MLANSSRPVPTNSSGPGARPVGVRAAASICALDFVPLQRERYDLVIPKAHYETLRGLKIFLDTIVSKPFRQELEALGGYDTRETGAMRNLQVV